MIDSKFHFRYHKINRNFLKRSVWKIEELSELQLTCDDGMKS